MKKLQNLCVKRLTLQTYNSKDMYSEVYAIHLIRRKKTGYLQGVLKVKSAGCTCNFYMHDRFWSILFALFHLNYEWLSWKMEVMA